MTSGIHLSTPVQLQGRSCVCLPTRLVAHAALRAASHQQRQRSSLISSSLKGLKQHAPQRSLRLQCSAQQATGEGPSPPLLMMQFSSGSSVSGVYLAVNFRKGFLLDASLCIGTLHLLELLASFHKIPSMA